ncbi:DUF2388 domain-containing protein [Pseudomonas sp.]|jgi:uncharacterized protein (TIGR02448 family)|uniref:DUF2388 domain-containing protein n=1 Tax=Pseudomonas sp. TaxID=306 RepID=UPI0028A6F66D|nr:DUF2388 domain-containing protein [Pseudomonas sp.]
MRRFILLSSLLIATPTFASSFVATLDQIGDALSATVDGTSDLTSSVTDSKLVPARADAASFVASEGEIRGARLEAALRYLRESGVQPSASDMQLAEAILAR